MSLSVFTKGICLITAPFRRSSGRDLNESFFRDSVASIHLSREPAGPVTLLLPTVLCSTSGYSRVRSSKDY